MRTKKHQIRADKAMARLILACRRGKLSKVYDAVEGLETALSEDGQIPDLAAPNVRAALQIAPSGAKNGIRDMAAVFPSVPRGHPYNAVIGDLSQTCADLGWDTPAAQAISQAASIVAAMGYLVVEAKKRKRKR